ncbi:MAG: pyridoxal phosphate-dependent aminotransferase [Desulfovibrionaceae bacterium]
MSGFDLLRLAPPHVRGFEPYTPAPPDNQLMRLHGLSRLYRLNNNENVLGPTPKARMALETFPASHIPIYPHGDCHDLRHALADRFGLSAGQFLVGNGSCEVIASVIKSFCQPGDNIVTGDKTFAVYEWVAQFSGIEPRLVPLKDHGFDPEAMLAAMDGRTKVVFVCNPNNPTGSCWDTDTLETFLAQVAGRAMVVLDEAYFEYVERPGFPNGVEMLSRHPNLIVFRTFSKMYALAALRVGWLCASSEVTNLIRRTHVAYSVSSLAEAAALASLEDEAGLVAATRRMVAEGKAMLGGLCAELGLETIVGEGNYLMLRTPLPDTLLHRKLLARGFLVRAMTGFRYPGWIRASILEAPTMEAFGQALREVLASHT